MGFVDILVGLIMAFVVFFIWGGVIAIYVIGASLFLLTYIQLVILILDIVSHE